MSYSADQTHIPEWGAVCCSHLQSHRAIRIAGSAPTRYEMVAAKLLGIDVPPTLLADSTR